MLADLDRAREALQAIPADLPRDDWVRAGLAAHAAGLSFYDFDAWSAGADNYKAQDTSAVWRSFKPGKVGEGTLFHMAQAAGWRSQRDDDRRQQAKPCKAPARPQAAPQRPRPGMGAGEVWSRCHPATAEHPYIEAKQGRPDGLRVVPAGDPLRIAGVSVVGWLVVPVVPLTGGEPASLQFIAPSQIAARLKAKERPTKPNLPGAPMAGAFIVGELLAGGTVYLCEGIGQAWACWKATGAAAVCCFGWGRVRGVAVDLRQRDPSAGLVLVPDVGKEGEAESIAREVAGQVVAMPEGWPQNADVNDLAQREGFDVLEALLSAPQGPVEAETAPLPFAVVPFADLATAEPATPAFVWDGLIPVGHVTLLSAHGGTGKSMVALMACVSVALGLPLLGIPTRQGNAAFYSGEDGAELLRYRLRLVCRAMGVSVDDLAGRLFILDATDDDPTLFAEVATSGRREGVTTATFVGLCKFMDDNAVSFVVVDNASDAFDASEIDRARVRGFVRALARIARAHDAGVLLLAHVDKGTSRGDRGPNSEGYSGSTAWHNSARSRLFMSRDKDGTLLLEHQKNNLGKLHDPLRLLWLEGGIPQADEPMGPMVQGIADRGQTKSLLKLIAEYTMRGEVITTATTSRTHAAKLLHQESTYPKLKDSEVFDLLRRAERAGQLERVIFKGSDRHQRERWQVTEAGAAFAGIAADTAGTAGTAATTEVTAPIAPAADAAGTAATSLPGGVGETAPHKVTAEAAARGTNA